MDTGEERTVPFSNDRPTAYRVAGHVFPEITYKLTVCNNSPEPLKIGGISWLHTKTATTTTRPRASATPVL